MAFLVVVLCVAHIPNYVQSGMDALSLFRPWKLAGFATCERWTHGDEPLLRRVRWYMFAITCDGYRARANIYPNSLVTVYTDRCIATSQQELHIA